MNPIEVSRGDSPLVLGLPHTGTGVPEEVRGNLNERGRQLADTDWHIDRLYDGIAPGATTVRATFSRYVIDANRPPDGASLYPGQATTGLVPLTDFDGEPLWKVEPDEAEIERRRSLFHAPYHEALRQELERVRAAHGVAVLYDCHSIRSHVPRLFDGELPVLNIGTNDGRSCAPALESIVHELAASSPYATVLNGRFKGGWTTRQYGDPGHGVHALQMEIAQRAYLADEAPPWTYDEAKAKKLRRWLADIVEAVVDEARDLAFKSDPEERA